MLEDIPSAANEPVSDAPCQSAHDPISPRDTHEGDTNGVSPWLIFFMPSAHSAGG